MRRLRRATDSAANPFVVFSDLTIALAFIFLVYALSTSQAILGVTRVHRQESLIAAIEKKYLVHFPRGKVDEVVKINQENRGPEHVWEFRPHERAMANMEVRLNAGLLRVMIWEPVFRANTATIAKDSVGQSLLLGVADSIRDARHSFTYLFLHGITDAPTRLSEAGRAVALSELRARSVLHFLQRENIIGAFPETEDSNKIRPSRVITFGTGFWLYATLGTRADRVDLVAFYNDNGSAEN